MAQATEAQIKQYELAHKQLLVDLATANFLWLGMQKQLTADDLKNKVSARYKAWQNYSKVILKVLRNWANRQIEIEKGTKQRFDANFIRLFFKPDASSKKKLENYVIAFVSGQSPKINGVGLAPLVIPLIWAVIALAALFTASYITKRLTETAEEKTELINATNTALKELKITPEKAAEIIIKQEEVSQTKAEKGLFGDITELLKTGLFIFVALKGVELLNQNKN